MKNRQLAGKNIRCTFNPVEIGRNGKMREEIKRAVIAIAWQKQSGQAITNIYSFQTGKHTPMSSTYDYEARAHFTDSFHHGTGTHFQISLSQNNFTGYDFDSNVHFSGSISGRNVQIFVGGRYFNYSV